MKCPCIYRFLFCFICAALTTPSAAFSNEIDQNAIKILFHKLLSSTLPDNRGGEMQLDSKLARKFAEFDYYRYRYLLNVVANEELIPAGFSWVNSVLATADTTENSTRLHAYRYALIKSVGLKATRKVESKMERLDPLEAPSRLGISEKEGTIADFF